MTMAANAKDTIYVDVDDEITTIIDKVRASEAKIVALVLPKRASVFQSVVNMKLLKRTAEAAKKHVVLITTEPNLMPLAASVGLHVAATPQSKPEIPSAVDAEDSSASGSLDDTEEEDFSPSTAGNRPVGELAGTMAASAPEAMETLDLPDDDEEPIEDTSEGEAKPKKSRKLAVPNFNKFRLRLFLAALVLVLLVVGFYLAAIVLPKATIAISTNTSNVNANFNMTLDTAAQALDTSKRVVPAKVEQQQKTTSQQVATTGQKNTGDVASGTADMSVQACAPNLGTPKSVPSGTGLSTNGLTFITQQTASFTFLKFSSGSCALYTANNVPVTAQNAGAKYNVDNATFTVAGRPDVSATGSASGGTDNIIQVVAQADIDSATQKLAAQDTAAIKASLEQTLQGDGMYPLPATFNAGNPVITTSNNVGDQAANVTVTQAVTYTMYGAKQTDLVALIKSAISSQIDPSSQTILSDGLANAKLSVLNTASGSEQVSLQAVATIGPDINTSEIKKEVAGKKAGDVQSLIGNIPGVTTVEVHLSPFWVSTVPSNASKVQVTVSGAK